MVWKNVGSPLCHGKMLEVPYGMGKCYLHITRSFLNEYIFITHMHICCYANEFDRKFLISSKYDFYFKKRKK